MRHLRLPTAAAIALLAALAITAVPAGAQEAEPDISHAAEECIHILEEGGDIDDCQEAPNPLLPEINELIWGAIAFTAVLLGLWFFGYPAVKRAMNERTERIQADLDAAEAAKAEAQSVAGDYEARLAEARQESARIIEEARQSADRMRADQQARLQEELAQQRERAQADIEAARSQALTDLRGDVTSIALGAAEAVVGQNLDRQRQVQLIEDYINRVNTVPQS